MQQPDNDEEPPAVRDEPIYSTAPRPTTFRDGVEFQDFVCIELAKQGVILQNLGSKRHQLATGENLQGFEIKLDRRCTDTGRLSIEIAEKSNALNPRWIRSGIYRNDNSWLYIQGNETVLFVMCKKYLRRLHKSGKYEEAESYGTVRKFYLPMDQAEIIASKVIRFGQSEAA